MFGREPNELDNLWDAYITHGELKYSDNFKLVQNEFYEFFELLVSKKIISKSKYMELDEKLGDLICESENQAFRQGYIKGLGLKTAIINEEEKNNG